MSVSSERPTSDLISALTPAAQVVAGLAAAPFMMFVGWLLVIGNFSEYPNVSLFFWGWPLVVMAVGLLVYFRGIRPMGLSIAISAGLSTVFLWMTR